MLNWFIQDLNQIYGQPAVFARVVRDRHFSSKSFTDRRAIFIDVSVNVNDFVKWTQTVFDDEQTMNKGTR